MKSNNALRGLNMAIILPLGALAGWLAIVTPLRADKPLTYLTQFGSPGTGNGQFEYLEGIGVDSSNNVYVADSGNNRVQKFDRYGNYLTQWGVAGSGNGQFDHPEGIAVDSSNSVYVTDGSNHRVQKFTASGRYLTQWGSYGSSHGQFAYPDGIAVDSDNNVYVTDVPNNRVQKFTSSGTYLTQWASDGSGQFNAPAGVAVDGSNDVYVADSANSRVGKFDGNGDFLTQLGSSGNGNGQFNFPLGIAADSSNNVYVADSDNNRVEKFDRNGDYLAQWGSGGSGNGQFANPEGVAVGSAGNFIYVTDIGNNRVEVFANLNQAPPFIMQQPANQVAVVGANVIITVGVVGGAPFAYQWNSNGLAIPGATNATLTLADVSLSTSGNYSVLITNIYGGILSSNAILTVLGALATTQPASELSVTGATLNGSVTVGPDETVAWFDWGTGTNYGNVAGTTVVPGNGGSNAISATLRGLPGNVYHYRLESTNDLGIVYGGDQSFTVGFAPRAKTLPPTNGANGATLNALVNPEGWDTTVYFQWQTPTLTNTTPGMDIGAGAASVSVSALVPDLSASTTYQYKVVASNALGVAFGAVAWYPNQTHYTYTGSKTNITLAAGAYIITAYGAPGGGGVGFGIVGAGGYGAEMSAQFNFPTSTNLTLLVGGGGGNNYSGGGGGGSFVVGSTPLVIAGGGGGAVIVADNGIYSLNGGSAGEPFPDGAGDGGSGGGSWGGGGGGGFLGSGGGGVSSAAGDGGFSFEDGGGGGSGYGGGSGGFGGGGGASAGGGGGGGYNGGVGGYAVGTYYGGGYGLDGYGGGGGGSIIDPSAIIIFAQVAGIASPDDQTNGEIIIITVPPPSLAISADSALGFTNGIFSFNVTGPAGASAVIQASTDLQTWIPLQTNVLGGASFFFSDTNAPANLQRFYRIQFLP